MRSWRSTSPLPVTCAVAIVFAGPLGCAGQTPKDVLMKAADGMARPACENASNCTSRCPSGEKAKGPLYACPEE
jgi:hypothetical protein